VAPGRTPTRRAWLRLIERGSARDGRRTDLAKSPKGRGVFGRSCNSVLHSTSPSARSSAIPTIRSAALSDDRVRIRSSESSRRWGAVTHTPIALRGVTEPSNTDPAVLTAATARDPAGAPERQTVMSFDSPMPIYSPRWRRHADQASAGLTRRGERSGDAIRRRPRRSSGTPEGVSRSRSSI